MTCKGYDIEIETVIKSISESPIKYPSQLLLCGNPQKGSYKMEVKEVFLDLIAKIDQDEWEIPYSIGFIKRIDAKIEEVEIPEESALSEQDSIFEETQIKVIEHNKISYRRERNLNIPLFELANHGPIETLIDFLILVDHGSCVEISHDEYDKGRPVDLFHNFDDFLSGIDKINLSNRNNINYCIRLYYGQAKDVENFYKLQCWWKVPHINLKNKKTRLEGEIVLPPYYEVKDIPFPHDNEYIKSHPDLYIPRKYVFDVLPQGFKGMSFVENKNKNWNYTNERGSSVVNENIFNGTYEECEDIVLNDEAIRNLIIKRWTKKRIEEDMRIRERRNNAYDEDFGRGNWEREYFDFMTGGQLGDFDDYYGNMDDIDTWSQG